MDIRILSVHESIGKTCEVPRFLSWFRVPILKWFGDRLPKKEVYRYRVVWRGPKLPVGTIVMMCGEIFRITDPETMVDFRETHGPISIPAEKTKICVVPSSL